MKIEFPTNSPRIRQFVTIQPGYSPGSGNCEDCGLPIWIRGGMSIPGLRGHYCSLLCVESALFGPGKCRWCAAKLESHVKKFCSEGCAEKSNRTPFGNGERFIHWIQRNHPDIYERVIGRNGESGFCLACGAALDGKHRDAIYCGSRCKMRYSRKRVQEESGKAKTPGFSVTAA